ncbi:hypothetical protein O7630_34685 [Micromonospora sp. WMMD718]|uniref:hypothetical protein n=1 Tax=Micromonospora sp. WMMD718 TaxID=3016098 RepID=UPI002416B0FB|nr:hypothetical protein [Micromonospora sp. WMMD718]MDG4756039.1 hypothetical protein [Micromonospora sp. WMMD718]MDG4756093.1 hypothetical protein [Micromonospora sp. WMMD718]
MQTTIQASATDADARDLAEARRLAAQLKTMTPDGLGYRNTVRRYEQVVARLGYDPIS